MGKKIDFWTDFCHFIGLNYTDDEIRVPRKPWITQKGSSGPQMFVTFDFLRFLEYVSLLNMGDQWNPNFRHFLAHICHLQVNFEKLGQSIKQDWVVNSSGEKIYTLTDWRTDIQKSDLYSEVALAKNLVTIKVAIHAVISEGILPTFKVLFSHVYLEKNGNC